MSKFESKAKELLARVQKLLDSFEVVKSSTYGVPDDLYAPDEITDQFPDILLDVQILFFSDSPQHPLYVRAMELNKRIEWVVKGCGNKYQYSDFATLSDMLQRYIQYRSFLEAEG